MQDQIEKLTRQYIEAGRLAADRARVALENGAELVGESTSQVKVMTDSTLKLNRISHNSAARLVRVQSEFVEGTIEGAAKRLQAVATASSVRSLFDSQVRLMPETRDRIVTDARKTLDVLGDTRDDLTALVRETLTDLRGGKSAGETVDRAVGKVRRETAPVVNKARSAARKTTRAATGKSAPTVKKTTRKTSAAAKGRPAARKTTRRRTTTTTRGRKTTG